MHATPEEVYDLIADVGTFLSPVGRLDLDTSGLLLMTNDNQFAERVTTPAFKAFEQWLWKALRIALHGRWLSPFFARSHPSPPALRGSGDGGEGDSLP